MTARTQYKTLRAVPLAAFLIGSAGPVAAQVTYTLQHSLTPPATRLQAGTALGTSVAVDAGLTVAGAPYDDTGEVDSGVAKVFDSATGALLHVLTNPVPGQSNNFGLKVAVSGTRVVVATGTAAQRVCVYDLSSATPAVPLVTLGNPQPGAQNSFGISVAISGALVAVGAHGGIGIAYVYDVGSATPAVPVWTLNNPGPAADDNFGRSVGISGTRIVVGTPSDDTGASNAGSAYVYDLTSATPTVPVRTLNNPSPAAGDAFGIAVAISGTRITVGVPFDDTGANAAGIVYAYDLSSVTPAVPVTTFNNPQPANQDRWGYNMAISNARVVLGDTVDGSFYVHDLSSGAPTTPVMTINKPGFGPVAISGTQVLVGFPGDDTGATDAGSAYGYDVSSVTPIVPVAEFHSPGPAAGDVYGNAVAISGNHLIVGALREDTGAESAGSAYAYDLSSATPTVPVAVFHKPGPLAYDYLGDAVAISGSRVVVGIPGDGTSSANQPGSARLYDLSSATPESAVAVFEYPGALGGTYFGISVAVSGTRIVVGASNDDMGAPGAGRAYIYDATSATPAVPVMALDNPNPAPNDGFGSSVATSGTHIAVSAPRSDIGATDAGRVYVFAPDGATPTAPFLTLNNPSPANDEQFGREVAISGTRVVVGAPFDDTGAIDAGIVYVYDLSSATPTVPKATINNPGPANGDAFGISVGISGTRVIVGTLGDDTGAPDTGTAYVYDLSSSTPTVPVATINNPRLGAGDNFSTSVAIDGATVAIGSPFADTPGADEGYAHTFTSDADGDGLLDGWEIARFGAAAGHSALDDFDHDGYNELLEMAFGLNPAVPNPGDHPAAVNEGGYLTMTIIKQPGVTYEVQSAGTLQPGLPDSFSDVNTTVLVNDATTLKVRDNFLIGTPPSRFLRVKVTAAP